MRSILLAAALTGAAFTFPVTSAVAQNEPWCSAGREDGGENCRFNSYEQCRATGPDGWCIRNSHGAPAAQAPATAQMVVPAETPAPVETRPVRKRPDTRQTTARPAPAMAARPTTNSPARPATNIVPPRAIANVSIPVPDRALLAPPPDFNCEFTGGVSAEANAARQPTLASANPDAARMKADYERQCYRHVELISRDRLRRLQASAGAIVKAVHRGEPAGSRTPVPTPVLLAAPPEFNCEYKAGGDAPAPGPAADAALQTKLDYELQCYRHASIIWRDRIQQLQASIGETIKAVGHNKQPTAEQRRTTHN